MGVTFTASRPVLARFVLRCAAPKGGGRWACPHSTVPKVPAQEYTGVDAGYPAILSPPPSRPLPKAIGALRQQRTPLQLAGPAEAAVLLPALLLSLPGRRPADRRRRGRLLPIARVWQRDAILFPPKLVPARQWGSESGKDRASRRTPPPRACHASWSRSACAPCRTQAARRPGPRAVHRRGVRGRRWRQAAQQAAPCS